MSRSRKTKSSMNTKRTTVAKQTISTKKLNTPEALDAQRESEALAVAVLQKQKTIVPVGASYERAFDKDREDSADDYPEDPDRDPN